MHAFKTRLLLITCAAVLSSNLPSAASARATTGTTPQDTAAAAAPSRADEAELQNIWRAALRVIANNRPANRRVVVVSETIGICGEPAEHPCFRSVASSRAYRDRRVTPELQRRLDAVLRESPIRIEVTVPAFQPMARSELLRRQLTVDPEQFWNEWDRDLPGTFGYVLLSAPALNADNTAGLLLLRHAYGSLGAKLMLLLVERERSGWRVEHKWILAMA